MLDRRNYPGVMLAGLLMLAAIAAPAQMSEATASRSGNHAEAPAQPASESQKHGVVRTYYIAADEVDWDYTPHGRHLAGVPRRETGDDDSVTGTQHRVYHKAIYREYTDATFKTLKTRPQQLAYLGILGPLIRAEVGDTVRVVFRNNTHLSLTMHPHGLEYKKDAEGAMYEDGTMGAAKADDLVAPGHTYTYIWSVPERSGPGPMDGSSVIWMYHSHFVESTDMNTGLVGPIIVTRRGMARPDGSPKDVDREFILDFAIFDETDSWFWHGNSSGKATPVRVRSDDPVIREQNMMYSINGYIEGNLPMMTMRRGEHVRWYLLSNSNEDDVHMAHWHGNTVLWNEMRVDSIPLEPMSMAVGDMVPDNVGIWLVHCHVNEHFTGGMVGRYQVLP